MNIEYYWFYYEFIKDIIAVQFKKTKKQCILNKARAKRPMSDGLREGDCDIYDI